MIPNAELDNGKIELFCEILDVKDIHDVELLFKFKREINNSFLISQNVNKDAVDEN